MNPPTDVALHWRVTATSLTPRYFLTQHDAHQYAVSRAHLHPVTAWQQVYPNHATGLWYQLEDDPRHCDQCGTTNAFHVGNRCPETVA